MFPLKNYIAIALMVAVPSAHALELNVVMSKVNQAASYLSGSLGKSNSPNVSATQYVNSTTQTPVTYSTSPSTTTSTSYVSSTNTSGTAGIQDDCDRLNQVIANTASRRADQIKVSQRVSDANDKRGVWELLLMPLGANPLADTLAAGVTTAMSNFIQRKAQGFIDEKLINPLLKEVNGVVETMKPITDAVQPITEVINRPPPSFGAPATPNGGTTPNLPPPAPTQSAPQQGRKPLTVNGQ